VLIGRALTIEKSGLRVFLPEARHRRVSNKIPGVAADTDFTPRLNDVALASIR
jgi:hypothetical protein